MEQHVRQIPKKKAILQTDLPNYKLLLSCIIAMHIVLSTLQAREKPQKLLLYANFVYLTDIVNAYNYLQCLMCSCE